MALATYSDLKDAIATWLARSGDTKITGNAADYVTMAQAYLNRTLRVREMETTTTFTTTDGSTNLPDDFLAWRRVTYQGDTYVSLEYLNPDVFYRVHNTAVEGVPTHFTIEGSDIIVRPYDDDTNHSLLYYAKLAAFDDDDDADWLLTAYPDLYLSAAMVEANSMLMNADHAALWAQKRDAIIDQLQRLSEKHKGPAAIIPIGNFY